MRTTRVPDLGPAPDLGPFAYRSQQYRAAPAACLAPNGPGVAIGPKGRNPTPDRYTKRKRAGRNSVRMGAYGLLDLSPV